jgi:pilus assembly protein Flp/PilA
MTKFLRAFSKNESGVTAIEYGLIAALVAVAGVTAFDSLGGRITGTMNSVGTKMPSAPAA